ncbi:Rieske 2Fe-2S domain-containing protein [Streptomyces sp. NPDC056600]|uniref:Rieske 2Fe-2S domain-containing protein n=1 Tax=Streptomyces sp. NPDC056600 TaxID=3345874 RepID=UPI00368E78C5
MDTTERDETCAKSRGPGRVASLLDGLERWGGADRLADAVQKVVRAAPLGRRGRDLLHGLPIGHPLHPVLVQVPVGAWMSTAVLDLLPGQERAARRLVGVGLAVAGPAAVAGWVDWADLQRQQRRVGLLHAALNNAAVWLYAGSYAARRSGRQGLGRGLAVAGLTAVSVGGALGGHLAYRQAAGANHAEQVPHLVRPGWHGLGGVSDLPIGQAVRRKVDDVPVMVVRVDEDTVRVLADQCSHLAGPLSQGEISDGCVRCPWHGSVFRLEDGWNVRGPATAPQPAFDTRVVDGRLEVRLRGIAPASQEEEPARAG